MSSPEVILNFAQTYGIDPDLLYAFSCFELLAILGGLSVVAECVIVLIMRFSGFIKRRRSAPPDDG